MVKREKLYDAFGELIYAIAMSDGAVQEEEIKTLELFLSQHPWAKEIKWSFNYENQKNHTVEEAYQKAIEVCKENGPDPEYKLILDLMTNVAESFDGIVKQEKELIEKFRTDLRDRFIKDMEENKLGYFDRDGF
ncbi:MAG: TerB family tellurite resistance protein [Bacteroidetes bacterium]|nr:MAG: TerB family tellurite resistance protein [Bacteroidota bacterium]